MSGRAMHYHANGKLLLSGEYLVLEGATALALPIKYGQRMDIDYVGGTGHEMKWSSYNSDGKCWFQATFSVIDFSVVACSDAAIASRLQGLLRRIQQLQSAFSDFAAGVQVSTHLEFPGAWGLGSSSTLIYLLGQWANVNPFALSEGTFGGSGYDLACAGSSNPIFYQRLPQPHWQDAPFAPAFHDQLCFAYLGHKRNSRHAIRDFRERKQPSPAQVERISQISLALAAADSISDFAQLLDEHEQVLASILQRARAQATFPYFNGVVKSLGAWGGDFVLLAGGNPWDYLTRMRWTTFFRYSDLALGLMCNTDK